VTEQFLNGPQIGPAIEQVGGERVSQGVRMRGTGAATVHHPTHVSGSDAPAPSVEEQGRTGLVGPHLASTGA